MKLDFNDLLIVPKDISNINSRAEISPYRGEKLPIITAPMDTVLSDKNVDFFRDNKLEICQPRCFKVHYGFKSYSIQQMRNLYMSKQLTPSKYLIDVANGHMDGLRDLTRDIKRDYPNLTLMVGNIANPETYRILSEAGADYIRVGIGNGGGCFLENSTVTTKSGDKLIQDIEIGDIVLTHTGEYKEVISTIAYPSREELIKINDTVSTKTHEYYVLNKKYVNLVDDDNIHNYAEWIKAENLTNEYFLLEYEEND